MEQPAGTTVFSDEKKPAISGPGSAGCAAVVVPCVAVFLSDGNSSADSGRYDPHPLVGLLLLEPMGGETDGELHYISVRRKKPYGSVSTQALGNCRGCRKRGCHLLFFQQFEMCFVFLNN